MKVTIITAFSKEYAVDKYINNLNNAVIKADKIDFIGIIDSDNNYIIDRIHNELDLLRFNYFRIIKNDWRPNETNIVKRRNRITDIYNQFKKYIKNDTDYVIIIEDDSVFGEKQIQRLIDLTHNRKKLGLIQGVQVGRWELRIIGAWQVDNIKEPKEYWTILPGASKKLEKIAGGGLYFLITPYKLFVKHNFYWKEPAGPDFYYGLELNRQGYNCWIDWNINIGHLVNDSKILWPEDRLDIYRAKI